MVDFLKFLVLRLWQQGEISLDIDSVVGLRAILLFASLTRLPSSPRVTISNLCCFSFSHPYIAILNWRTRPILSSHLKPKCNKSTVGARRAENCRVLNELFILRVRQILDLLTYLILRVEGVASQKWTCLFFPAI